MRNACVLSTLGVLMLAAATASANDGLNEILLAKARGIDVQLVQAQREVPPLPAPELSPVPESAPGTPYVVHDSYAPVAGAPVELYPHVKYKDHDEMHPCAEMTVVCVPAPQTCRHKCDCCPQMVHVAICVPPHCPPQLDIKRHGREYEYSYGEYAVDVRIKRGYIEVDYQD